MAKKTEPQGYYNPETGEAVQIVKPKKKKTWLWILIALVILAVIGANAGNKSDAPKDAGKGEKTAANASADKSGSDTPAQTDADTAPDLSNVATEYILTAGQYYAGTDIPCGKFDLVAVSGSGNVSSSNIYSGGINGLYAKPGDGPDYYDEAYNGIKLPEGERINICGDLTVKITYSRIDAGYTGRTEDTANTITLIQGNYDVGADIPEGIYTVRVTEGSGNIAYNVYGGGLNEIMGAPGTDNSTLAHIPEFKNAYFPAGNELTIRNMTVELIPMIPGATP